MSKIKGFQYIVDFLIHNGYDTFFLVTGGAIVPLVDYLGTNKSAKFYCFQHEQSAAMAAESFYRTSGKMITASATKIREPTILFCNRLAKLNSYPLDELIFAKICPTV